MYIVPAEERINRQRIVNSLSATEQAYIAGIVDGEGCVRIVKDQEPRSSRGLRLTSCLTIANSDIELLTWLKTTTGVGSVYVKYKVGPGHKPAGQWKVSSRQAADLIEQLKPYLRIKRRQADLLIEFANEASSRINRSALSDSEFNRRIRQYEEMKALNKKGV